MRPTAYNPRQCRDSAKNRESGFSLVELAISLVVIGLLIGGFLKGNELLANVRINKTIQDIKNYEGAITAFKDAYRYLPGDIPNPATLIPNCDAVGSCSYSGNGDGVIDGSEGSSPWHTQLIRAGFLTEAMRGSLIKRYTVARGAPTGKAHVGHYLRAANRISGMSMFQIDRKMDDGIPLSGRIRPTTAVTCTVGSLGVEYVATKDPSSCELVFLLLH